VGDLHVKVSVFQDAREARATNTKPERLIELAAKEGPVRTELAQNPNTPAEALRIIAASTPDDKLRSKIAKHPNSPADLLFELASSSDLGTLAAIAEHPNTPETILRAFSERSLVLQRAVANNPTAPSDLLARLAIIEDNSIHAALARNPNTPPTVALRCGEKFPSELQKNTTLSAFFLENPELLVNLSANFMRSFLYFQRPPEWVWKAAAQHKDPSVRVLALKHKNVPAWVVAELSKDKDPKVQQAANPNQPTKQLKS
jgi:hypothetical protein